MPRLNGSRSTCAPRSTAIPAVRSTEPSSTTTTSIPGSKAFSSSITRPTLASSFIAGTIASRFSDERPATCSAGGAASSSSAMRSHSSAHSDPEQIEQPARAVAVRVLVEDARARIAAELLGCARVGQQLAIRGNRFLGGTDDEQFAARLEPAVDPVVRVRDDRGAGGRKLEQAARRRCVHRRMRLARDVEVDMTRGDHAREERDGEVAEFAGAADVAAEVCPAQDEVDVVELPRRVADHRLHPVATELVAVRVEED